MLPVSLDIRRFPLKLKDGEEVIGNQTKVKVSEKQSGTSFTVKPNSISCLVKVSQELVKSLIWVLI